MEASQPGLRSSLRGTRLVLLAFVAIVLLATLGRALTAAYVEILWQNEVGYAGAFWTRMAWEWGLRVAGGLAIAALVFGNLRIAASTLGGIQIRRRFGNLEISEQLPRRYVTWALVAVSALLGLWFGAAITPGLGRRLLFLLHAGPWGLAEPVLGHDAGFYVYWLPVLRSAALYAITAVFLVFTLATATYAATGALSWRGGRIAAHALARVHLGVLLASFFLLLAMQLWLGRYWLLVDGSSAVQGIFGFADAHARLPALQTQAIIAVGAAGATAFGAWRSRPAWTLAGMASVVFATLVIGELYPSLVQSFRVEPNELERETPYIEHNLDFTKRAFALDELERRPFTHRPEEALDRDLVAAQLAGLPVWSREALLATYQQNEALFPYYDFLDVTIDRYRGPDGPVPVALAVREIDPDGIQDQNWQNLHLRELYVAGMGAVASLGAERSVEGRPEMLVRGIPPVRGARAAETLAAPAGLDLERPEVFFGTRRQQRYAVVSPGPDQYLAPDSTRGAAGVDFPAGIPLRSKVRTALLAWRFRDANLLFASELSDESRFIFRRTVVERAQAVAPFLLYPEDPYPVVADGRIVWILEGFSASGYFPLASTADFQGLRSPTLRWVRNSFKITVDAVTGRVNLYRVPVSDPFADMLERAFPDLFTPIERMPDGVREHVRYSRRLFELQARVLLQYHQETAPAFHGQQDVWNTPQELAEGTSPVAYRPEYGVYRLTGDAAPRYQISTLFVPADRQNLTAMLVGRTDERGVGELVLLDVPVEDQVRGPRLIEALVEQDPEISQQFSLWRTGGSQVWTGHLHLVPVGNRLVFMEPVFLAAEQDAIPELRRFVVSDGNEVVMTETLEDAISLLTGRAPPRPGPGVPVPGIGRDAPPDPAWPEAALELLNEADARARAGDWQGYGEALARLRELLESLGRGGV